jgi:hypothetical protein
MLSLTGAGLDRQLSRRRSDRKAGRWNGAPGAQPLIFSVNLLASPPRCRYHLRLMNELTQPLSALGQGARTRPAGCCRWSTTRCGG